MKQLHMIEVEIDVPALYRFLHMQGMAHRDDDTELGYGVHAWLGAALGDLAPQPWRLLMERHRPARILGYASHDASSLVQRLVEFGEPSVLRVCPEPHLMIASRPMPAWREGRRLGFQTLVCPVGRKAGTGIEKDIFLIHADAQDDGVELSRETIYCEWAKERFNRYSVTVDSIRLTGFRLVRQERQTQPVNGKRKFARIVRPQALLEGELTINNSADFTELLRHGIGRHRAFGYGMILLRPPSWAEVRYFQADSV
jgi:CRISPR system Cascade subunit CasE